MKIKLVIAMLIGSLIMGSFTVISVYGKNDELDTKSYLFTLAKLQTEKEKLMLLLNTEAIQQNLEWKEKTDEERRVLIHRYVAHVVIDMDIKQILKVELY